MRELAVYYCTRCGYYGYYQLPRNAVCPKCSVRMKHLAMRYQEFMNLDCKERDELLSVQIAETSSVVRRIMAPHKKANERELIAGMAARLEELEAENKKLNDTVDWMHELIWDLMRKNQSLK